MKNFKSLWFLALGLVSISLLQSCNVGVGVGYGYGGNRGYNNNYNGGYYGGGWHRRHWDMNALTATRDNSASVLASDYRVKPSSAVTIIEFAASTDKLAKLNSMGIDAREVAPIGELRMPTDNTVNKIAAHLGEDNNTIKWILRDFIRDLSTDKEVVSVGSGR